jgi:hypothetical protein
MRSMIGAIVILIIVGALAYRSATYIYGQIRGGYSARLAVAFSHSPVKEFLTLYVIAGLPLAFLNGFLLRFSWVDCLVVGVGTWVGMLVLIAVARRFNPVKQFYAFAGVTFFWLVVDIIRAFDRDSSVS